MEGNKKIPQDERYASVVGRLENCLKDFTSPEFDALDLILNDNVDRHRIEINKFPAPALIPFVMEVCSIFRGRRFEKIHWTIPFSYKGVNCVISLEEFGLRLYIDKKRSCVINTNDLLNKIGKSINIVEKYILSEFAVLQIDNANIAIMNQFNKLEHQYMYFREKAIECFAIANGDTVEKKPTEPFKNISAIFSSGRYAAYNALAMIDAYFSRLEHFLVLALPFTSFNRTADNMNVFSGKIWSQKLKRIFDIHTPPMCFYYQQLLEIKEKYRNTFAHGGFEKKGASFFFHLPGYGYISAQMSGHKKSVHFSLNPIDEASFIEITNRFDEFDSWLKNEGHCYAWMYAESGLNLQLDEDNYNEMQAAMHELSSFEKWIEKKAYFTDMIQNADY